MDKYIIMTSLKGFMSTTFFYILIQYTRIIVSICAYFLEVYENADKFQKSIRSTNTEYQ